MSIRQVADLQEGNRGLQDWRKQHHRAALLMAVPLAVGFALARFAPPAVGNIAMAFCPAISLTAGLSVIPADFRSRSGSLTPALCLVTAMWVVAIGAAVFSLAGRP